MKRQTIRTLLVVLLVVGMLVTFADPVAAETGFVAFSGSVAATLIPVSIEYPAQNRLAVSSH